MSALPPHLQRADLFKRLIEKDGVSITQIAQKYQKSLAFVSNTLRLLKLPEIIKEGLISGQISEGHARALLMVKDSQKTIAVYREIITFDLNVRKTEALAKSSNKTV